MIDDGYVDLDGEQLYISTLGSFHYLSQSVSEFQGIWYCIAGGWKRIYHRNKGNRVQR